jgi:hypothetical protein
MQRHVEDAAQYRQRVSERDRVQHDVACAVSGVSAALVDEAVDGAADGLAWVSAEPEQFSGVSSLRGFGAIHVPSWDHLSRD